MSRLTLVACLLLHVGAFSALSAQDQKSKSKAEVKTADTGTIRGKVDSRWVRLRPALVYLENVPGKFPLPKQNPVMDQRRLSFIPHILPVLVGSTVDFPNNDHVRHNVYAPSHGAKKFDLGAYPKGETRQVTFDRVGVVPVSCNVHSEMSAFILVLPNPHFAMTDKQGNFRLKDVPPGTYTLTFWHKRLQSKTAKVSVKSGRTVHETFREPFRELKKGRYNEDL